MNRTQVLVLIVIGPLLSACQPRVEPDVRAAVLAAMAPECSRGEAWQAMSNLAAGSPPPLIELSLGTNNFTTFMLTLPADSELTASGRYAFEMPQPLDPRSFGMHLSQHVAAVASGDLSHLEWTSQKDQSFRGTCRVETPYGLKATFLFEGRTQGDEARVTRFSVQRKDSSNLADGFPIIPRTENPQGNVD